MDEDFWHQRWQSSEIGFHEGQPNRLLVQYFGSGIAGSGARVFLPLCGKTRDIGWLLSQGYRVAGAELSEAAVAQLFEDLDMEPETVPLGDLTLFRADRVEIFAGNIFELTAATLGPVDAVYDRAALVALPGELRKGYAEHLMRITRHAPQLLITFEYDQSEMEGPPFSVSEAEVRRCYGGHYTLTHLAGVDVAGGLKGRCPATENVYLLRP